MSLVVAHPGHELLAYGWPTRVKPLVFVVTDGSGRDSAPRIEASARLLAGGPGRRASVFGRWTDRELYDALAEGRFEPFPTLRDAKRGLAPARVARGGAGASGGRRRAIAGCFRELEPGLFVIAPEHGLAGLVAPPCAK